MSQNGEKTSKSSGSKKSQQPKGGESQSGLDKSELDAMFYNDIDEKLKAEEKEKDKTESELQLDQLTKHERILVPVGDAHEEEEESKISNLAGLEHAQMNLEEDEDEEELRRQHQGYQNFQPSAPSVASSKSIKRTASEEARLRGNLVDYNVNERNIDDSDMFADSGTGTINRVHFRAIKFLDDGSLRFYETTLRTGRTWDYSVPGKADEHNPVPAQTEEEEILHEFINLKEVDLKTVERLVTFISQDAPTTMIDYLIISRKHALRNWVLNNPQPFKPYKKFRDLQELEADDNDAKLEKKKLLNGFSADSRLSPYEYFDINARLEHNPQEVDFIGKDGGVESKSAAIEQVTKSTGFRDDLKINAADRFDHKNDPKLKFLDRCFVYKTNGASEFCQVYIRHPKENTSFRAENFLYNDTDTTNADDDHMIHKGSIVWTMFKETCEVATRGHGAFAPTLASFSNDATLSGFIMNIHEQYSLRTMCEDRNFWRREYVTGALGNVERTYFVHSLNDHWALKDFDWADYTSRRDLAGSGMSPEDIDKKLSDRAEKEDGKAPMFEVFSSEAMAADDIFGEDSPLYFPGHVTYIMVYNKEIGMNEQYTRDVDVLAIITKIEDAPTTTITNVNAAYTSAREQRAKMKREIAEKRYHITLLEENGNEEDEDALQKLKNEVNDLVERLEIMEQSTRETRKPFDTFSSDSSSDSDDSVYTDFERDLKDQDISEYRKNQTLKHVTALRGGFDGDEDGSHKDTEIVRPPSEKSQDGAKIVKPPTTGSKKSTKSFKDIEKQAAKEEADREKANAVSSKISKVSREKEAPGTFIGGYICKHLVSIIFVVSGIVLAVVAQVIAVQESSNDDLKLSDQVILQKVEYSVLGLALFCVVIGVLVGLIRVFKDGHPVDSTSTFENTALQGKDYVVSKVDLLTKANTAQLAKSDLLASRRNHRVVVLYCNMFPTADSSNAVDTKYTVETSLGDITRVSDAVFHVDFSVKGDLNTGIDVIKRPPVDDLKGSKLMWRNLCIDEVRELTSANFGIAQLPHLAENEVITRKMAIKSSTKRYKSGSSSRKKWMTPDLRGLLSAFTIIWCAFCLVLLLGLKDNMGFYLLCILFFPAAFGVWDNPLATISGLFFAMHYGPSGGPVGKMLVTGYKRAVSPSFLTRLFAAIVTLVPVFFTVFEYINFMDEADTKNLTMFLDSELFPEADLVAIIVASIAVVSNIAVTATFTRRYFIEALEVLQPDASKKQTTLSRRFLSFYYAIENISLRLESCVFIVNCSQPETKLLMAEVSDLAKQFTTGDYHKRTEGNAFGITAKVGARSADALWGMIDDHTRDDVTISPVDPGFKSIQFQVSGATVFGAAYYASNFYRNSVTGLLDASQQRLAEDGVGFISKLTGKKAMNEEQKKALDRLHELKGFNPRGSGTVRVFFWHLSFILCIIFEAILYLPTFALFIIGYLLSGLVSGAIIFPFGLIFTLSEKIYSYRNHNVVTSGPPKNIFVKIFSGIVVILLTVQLTFFLWLKTIVVLFNLLIKLLISQCGKSAKSEFLMTPKLSLFFLPPLVPTDIYTAEELETLKTAKRKGIFKKSDAGYWFGDLNIFADIPLFPKSFPINLVEVDIRHDEDRLARGKLRSNRDDTIGVASDKKLDEVGLSR